MYGDVLYAYVRFETVADLADLVPVGNYPYVFFRFFGATEFDSGLSIILPWTLLFHLQQTSLKETSLTQNTEAKPCAIDMTMQC